MNPKKELLWSLEGNPRKGILMIEPSTLHLATHPGGSCCERGFLSGIFAVDRVETLRRTVPAWEARRP